MWGEKKEEDLFLSFGYRVGDCEEVGIVGRDTMASMRCGHALGGGSMEKGLGLRLVLVLVLVLCVFCFSLVVYMSWARLRSSCGPLEEFLVGNCGNAISGNH